MVCVAEVVYRPTWHKLSRVSARAPMASEAAIGKGLGAALDQLPIVGISLLGRRFVRVGFFYSCLYWEMNCSNTAP